MANFVRLIVCRENEVSDAGEDCDFVPWLLRSAFSLVVDDVVDRGLKEGPRRNRRATLTLASMTGNPAVITNLTT